jgi:hypothetical protein
MMGKEMERGGGTCWLLRNAVALLMMQRRAQHATTDGCQMHQDSTIEEYHMMLLQIKQPISGETSNP